MSMAKDTKRLFGVIIDYDSRAGRGLILLKKDDQNFKDMIDKYKNYLSSTKIEEAGLIIKFTSPDFRKTDRDTINRYRRSKKKSRNIDNLMRGRVVECDVRKVTKKYSERLILLVARLELKKFKIPSRLNVDTINPHLDTNDHISSEKDDVSKRLSRVNQKVPHNLKSPWRVPFRNC